MMMRVVMKPTPPVSVGDSVCDNPREALRMGGCPYYDYFTHNSVWFRGLMELREQTVAATEHYSFDPHKAQPRRLRTLSEVSQESRSKPGLEGQIKGRWPALNPPLESNPSETPRKARMAAPSPPPPHFLQFSLRIVGTTLAHGLRDSANLGAPRGLVPTSS